MSFCLVLIEHLMGASIVHMVALKKQMGIYQMPELVPSQKAALCMLYR